MEALFLLLFLGMLWSPFVFFDKNCKQKDWIILSEFMIMLLPFILFVTYLSRKISDNEMSMEYGWFLFISVPTLVSILFYLHNKKRFKQIDDENMRIVSNQIEWDNRIRENRRILKENYMTALRNGDKSNALQLGREYYSSLGLYDEQRIQNDLLCFLNIK
jgi:hypothetical protein